MRMQSGGDGQDQDVRGTVGVDTHADLHVGVALDQFGRRLGSRSAPTTPAGFAELVAWSSGFRVIEQIGIEGTGSYGAGLARWRRARGLTVYLANAHHAPVPWATKSYLVVYPALFLCLWFGLNVLTFAVVLSEILMLVVIGKGLRNLSRSM